MFFESFQSYICNVIYFRERKLKTKNVTYLGYSGNAEQKTPQQLNPLTENEGVFCFNGFAKLYNSSSVTNRCGFNNSTGKNTISSHENKKV